MCTFTFVFSYNLLFVFSRMSRNAAFADPTAPFYWHVRANDSRRPFEIVAYTQGALRHLSLMCLFLFTLFSSVRRHYSRHRFFFFLLRVISFPPSFRNTLYEHKSNPADVYDFKKKIIIINYGFSRHFRVYLRNKMRN